MARAKQYAPPDVYVRKLTRKRMGRMRETELQKASRELNEAWKKLIITLAEGLRIDKLLDWLLIYLERR